MTNKSIITAEFEARRFLDRVKTYKKSGDKTAFVSKHRAAIRRASMDLTRALAVMRKNDGWGDE